MVKAGEFIASSPVCSGDSGGPALDKSGRVSGVTSRGDDKCTIGIYSSVSAWRDFIIEKTFAAAESGHYAAPAWAGEPPAGFDPGVPTAGSSARGGNGGSMSSSGSGPVTVIAGAPGMGGASSVSPVVDPLGLSCTGQCPGAYKCWAASNKPPGICVPACSATESTCPTGYACDTSLAACIKPRAQTTVHESSGCSVAAASRAHQAAGGLWLGLGLLGLVWGARRFRRADGT
jgi:hypothetical protein